MRTAIILALTFVIDVPASCQLVETGRDVTVKYLLKNPNSSLTAGQKNALRTGILNFNKTAIQPSYRVHALYNGTSFMPRLMSDAGFSIDATTTRIILDFPKQLESLSLVQTLVAAGVLEKLGEQALVSYRHATKGTPVVKVERTVIRAYPVDPSNVDFWNYNVSISTP